MPYYDKEQIARAREMDLLTYLRRYEPHELIHDGGDSYRTRTHDSLKLSNGLWQWWSQGIGGRSALDYLTKVRGVDFTEAVGIILQDTPFSTPAQSRSPPQKNEPKPFVLPERYLNHKRVFAYLYSRGIDPEIINHCFRRCKLYQEAAHHNAVFVGFKGDTPVSATMRSTLSDSTYICDVEGSDKRYPFSFTGNTDNGALVVTESAIDLLSYLTLLKQGGHDWRSANGIALGGVSKPSHDTPKLPIGLEQYLKDYKEIRRIALCFDNDEAGSAAAYAIENLLEGYDVTCRLPSAGKDYNDLLRQNSGKTAKIKTRGGQAR